MLPAASSEPVFGLEYMLGSGRSWTLQSRYRLRMEGRWRRGKSLPGLPAHLYDLFPDRLVDSELGEIPEGWEVETISDLAEVVGGSTPKTGRSEYWEGGAHNWATPKISRGFRYRYCWIPIARSPMLAWPRSAPVSYRRERSFFRHVPLLAT
jgi:hypothetical protein